MSVEAGSAVEAGHSRRGEGWFCGEGAVADVGRFGWLSVVVGLKAVAVVVVVVV